MYLDADKYSLCADTHGAEFYITASEVAFAEERLPHAMPDA